jgi:hypothetical protein
MFPAPLSCDGANDIHCSCAQATDPSLHDEEVRFCQDVRVDTEIQGYNSDDGAANSCGMSMQSYIYIPDE